MNDDFAITLLGQLQVRRNGQQVELPASRKARALLGFLVTTGRPHRRERLCELFWDLPDDPKASLRWCLTKLRKVVDDPRNKRIVADRERVNFDATGVTLDIRNIQARLRDAPEALTVTELEQLLCQFDENLLDGLDGVGSSDFDFWLQAEREDMRAAHAHALKLIATHPDIRPLAASKWKRIWSVIDPASAKGEDAEQAEITFSSDERISTPPLEGAHRGNPAQETTYKPAVPREGLRRQRIGFCQVSDGTKIAFATVGKGPLMLKAANWLSHLELDWSTPIWGQGFAEFARARTFIRYDERGCGLSDWDTKELSFDAFVEDLEAVVENLGLERFPLLGISQGAAVCIEYAARHPERVSGLILVGGYAAGWRHAASPEEIAFRDAIRTLTEAGWGTDNPAYRRIFSQTFMPDAVEDERKWFDEFQRLTTSPKNAVRFLDAFADIDVRDRLAEVKAPTLVLHARGDQRISMDQGRALACKIPGAHFVPLESRNHILVNYEPAWNTMTFAVRDFLADYQI